MPDVRGEIRFLARDPQYEHVKPYIAAVPLGSGLDLEKFQVSNTEYEDHSVEIVDIRPFVNRFSLEENGFQVLTNQSKYGRITSLEEVEGYRHEAEQLLKKIFDAVEVLCFDFHSRKNIPYTQDNVDLGDPLQHFQPARDAHADYTFLSGPIVVKRVLKEKHLEQYLKPGYRFRLVNLWRSAVPTVTDLPLAMCDFRSLAVDDVVAGDRVRPDVSGEIFHVQHNPNQKWYFLDNMTPEEPWCFISYDSKAGDQARLCPHASFHPESRENGFRESYETRCVVVTKA